MSGNQHLERHSPDNDRWNNTRNDSGLISGNQKTSRTTPPEQPTDEVNTRMIRTDRGNQKHSKRHSLTTTDDQHQDIRTDRETRNI
ncbi:hypothetical protein JTB14_008226 [Gonioctena quinquepunctata]|nr:hypothetical protein JTB14_008226 [Gonioctena quinquepunctata]